MESYNDIVVVSFDNYLFVYNNLTGEVKTKTYRPLLDIIKDIDQEIVKTVVNSEGFKEHFYKHANKEMEVVEYIKNNY